MRWVAGVDGYKSRWFVVLKNLETGECRWRLVTAFADLLDLDEAPTIVAVDMPIGLPDVALAGGRACEKHARAALGPRRSSVFNAIGRSTLRSASLSEANASARAAGGTASSAQGWGLAAKLREVDAVMTPALQQIVREVHPEVCFWAMSNRVPMAFSKKTPEGYQARKEALVSASFPFDFIRDRPAKVGADDFLDACAAAWTASRIVRGIAERFPPEPDLDARGLDQAIWH